MNRFFRKRIDRIQPRAIDKPDEPPDTTMMQVPRALAETIRKHADSLKAVPESMSPVERSLDRVRHKTTERYSAGYTDPRAAYASDDLSGYAVISGDEAKRRGISKQALTEWGFQYSCERDAWINPGATKPARKGVASPVPKKGSPYWERLREIDRRMQNMINNPFED